MDEMGKGSGVHCSSLDENQSRFRRVSQNQNLIWLIDRVNLNLVLGEEGWDGLLVEVGT